MTPLEVGQIYQFQHEDLNQLAQIRKKKYQLIQKIDLILMEN